MNGPPGADAERIASSMETTPELLPYLPALLQDLDSLGASLELIVDAARAAGTATGHQILDVCCGKGAVAIALAARLGCRVHGLDLFPSFIEEAREAASAAGVADRCTFEEAEAGRRVRELTETGDAYDGVVLAAAGDVLGAYGETVAALRCVTRPSGWILIEDGYVPPDFTGPVHVGYEHYRPREIAVAELTAHGDTLEREIPVPRADVAAFNTRCTAFIETRARELARRHPTAAPAILAYAREQKAWSAAAEAMVTAIWVIRRA
jgi:SAM-dependent methyltransferase